MAKSPSKGSGQPIPRIEVQLDVSPGQAEELLKTLEARFEDNMQRHKNLDWSKIQAKLEKSPTKLSSLYTMESTGGEPDVVGYESENDEFIFMDCSEQSPSRRSICYDGEAEAERIKKGVHPGGNAVDLAAAMGIKLLDEEEYRALQKLGEFDTKSQSWVLTPPEIRKLGGAIFGDRRYNRVFVYHNSAPSFYGARGFRGSLKI